MKKVVQGILIVVLMTTNTFAEEVEKPDRSLFTFAILETTPLQTHMQHQEVLVVMLLE